jgi:CsoR family transcriptional regulator, copper-sensing transcriptional repressor
MSKEAMKADVLQRIRTIKGHIAAVEKMVEENKDCETVLFQLGAVRGAMDKLSAQILDGYASICLREVQITDEKARQRIESLTRTMVSMIKK